MFKDNILVKILAGIIFLSGLIVMIGWFANISVVKSILPEWISMKFTTAFCFLLSGILLFCVAVLCNKSEEVSQIIITSSSFFIFLIMATFLLGDIFNIKTGMESLFIQDIQNGTIKTIPGTPSIGSMIGFLLIATAGLVSLSQYKSKVLIFRIFGWVIFLIGFVAIVGYASNYSILYYSFGRISNPISFHGALLFVCSGLVLILVKNTQSKINK